MVEYVSYRIFKNKYQYIDHIKDIENDLKKKVYGEQNVNISDSEMLEDLDQTQNKELL